MIATIVKFIQRCGLTAEELNQHIYCCRIADGIPTVEFQIKAKWPVVKLSCKSGLCSFWHERFIGNKVKLVYFLTIPRHARKSVLTSMCCFFCKKLTKERKHFLNVINPFVTGHLTKFSCGKGRFQGNKEFYYFNKKEPGNTSSFITYFARVFQETPRK